MTKFFKNLLVISLVFLAGSFFQKDKLPDRYEILDALYSDPVQAAVESQPVTAKKGNGTYLIKPLYSYDIYGLIVSYHHSASFDDYYHKQWGDELNSKDIALVYGTNVKTGIYNKFSFKSGSWTARYEPKLGTSRKDWSAFDAAGFSNNHLLALDERVYKIIMGMRVGDQIHIKGFLVNYGTADYPESRRTSTVRTDTGCEVVLVNEATILKRANPGWRFMFCFSFIIFIASLVGFVIAFMVQKPYN